MPELDSVAGNARLLRGLIWAGVSLAPLAAAVVLLGTASNSVRFAVILIAVAVVLIGASVLVRNDPVVGRLDVEDRVAEEVAQLRRELRAEFGSGAAMPHPAPAPAKRPLPPQRGSVAPPPPPAEESGFFADVPPMYPEDDPFPGPSDDFPMQPAGPPPMQQPGPPMGAARPPAMGGRAGAAGPVRPPARTGPGMTTGGRPMGSPGAHDPGTVTGGRAGGAAVPPQQLPRQRGAASVPPPPQGPPRASASVRPGGPGPGPGGPGPGPGPGMGGTYSSAESISDDFGASNGYAAQAPGVYGAPAGGGSTYGAPNPGAGDDYSFDSDEYNGYGAPSYGQDQGEYGYTENGYADAETYPEADGYGRETGDPSYKARRHRPSANDTNVGSLSDFASYPGYVPEEPDDRYVQGYAPPRGRH